MSQDSAVPTAGTGFMSSPAFHVMLKPRGAICNLDCKYCYYLPKERLYPGSRFCMPDDLLDTFTRQYIEAQCVPEVTFVWQGGRAYATPCPAELKGGKGMAGLNVREA